MRRLQQYCAIQMGGWAKNGHLLNEDELIHALRGVEILVVGYEKVTSRVIRESPALQLIACCRSNPVNVDVQAAKERGIPLLYTPGRNANAVAEYTMGLILAEARSIARSSHTLLSGKYLGKAEENPMQIPPQQDIVWSLQEDDYYERFTGCELKGRTLGLVGLGNIGLRLAKIARGFELELIAYDPYIDEKTTREYGVRLLSLNELLSQADFVSIHCPVNAETYGMIGQPQIALMKPQAYLINTARGVIIQEQALLEALSSKRIAGAALDVFWVEPLPANHPLLTLDNVTLTPHLAGASNDVPTRHSQMIAEDVLAWITGQKPLRVFRNTL